MSSKGQSNVVPVSLLFWIVHVRVRTPVDTVAFQISSAPVDPARPHVVVGSIYTLEQRSDLYERGFIQLDIKPL